MEKSLQDANGDHCSTIDSIIHWKEQSPTQNITKQKTQKNKNQLATNGQQGFKSLRDAGTGDESQEQATSLWRQLGGNNPLRGVRSASRPGTSWDTQRQNQSHSGECRAVMEVASCAPMGLHQEEKHRHVGSWEESWRCGHAEHRLAIPLQLPAWGRKTKTRLLPLPGAKKGNWGLRLVACAGWRKPSLLYRAFLPREGGLPPYSIFPSLPFAFFPSNWEWLLSISRFLKL